MTVKSPWIALMLLLAAGAAAAQTAPEVPRFDGSRSGASSAAVVDPADPQYRSSPTALPGAPGAVLPVQNLPQALIGEAALEAAREEGRRFVDRRYWRKWFYGD